jgi:hypothetical protein
MAQLQIVQQVNRSMECSACGAAGIAACDCGAPYMPASTRAADAIAANPKKSNRAIATEIGVAEGTVRTARKSTAQDYAVDTRVGLDGKVRRMPKAKLKPEEVIPTEEEAEESYQQHLYVICCDQIGDMTDETRRKLFTHIRRKYRENI